VIRVIISLLLFFITNISLCQKVSEKSATIKFEQYNSIVVDGLLYFEIDVRLSDCLSHIEIIDVDKMRIKKNLWDKIYDWWWFKVRKKFDFHISKKYTLILHESDYYLREDGVSEQIYMKCELITLQSIFGRKYSKKRIQINLYSKTGKIVYSKKVILKKIKLVEEGEVRLGIEPS
jgi:hypothetical protein